MRLLSTNESVKQYLVDGDDLYFLRDNTIFKNELLFKPLSTDFTGSIYLNNQNLVIQSFLGNLDYLSFNLKGYYNYATPDIFIYLNTEDGYIHYLQNNSLKKTNLEKSFFLTEDIAIILEFESIEARKFPDGKYLWKYELNQLKVSNDQEIQNFKINKFIGFWKNELIVSLSNGLILCLDIASGKETRRFHQCPPYVLGGIEYSTFETSSIFKLDPNKNILLGIYAHFYLQIDLMTNKIQVVDLSENMKANKLDFFRESYDYAWDENYIYTIGEVAEHDLPVTMGDKSIIAFNRRNYNIDWQYIFEKDGIYTDVPQLENGKLYQLSASKKLYIFEPEP